jgi:multiubiquitin
MVEEQAAGPEEIIVIDIEVYVKEGKEVPKGRHYHYLIMVDRHKFKVEHECLTGREILKIAGKIPPDRFQLNQRFKSGKVVKIGYDQVVCFTESGIEKFMTIPLDQTEGGK